MRAQPNAGYSQCSLVSRILQALRQAEGERLRLFGLRISAARALARFDEAIVCLLYTSSDSLVNETTAVTLTASTNVTDDSALTYTWEWCELTTEDPRKSETVWTPMDGKASKEIRCV